MKQGQGRRIFKSVLLIACIGLLGAGVCLTFLHKTGLFEVTSIPVEVTESGTSSPSSPQIRGLQTRLTSALQKYAKKKIWQIDLQSIRASVSSDEWVKDVLISRTFPNHVTVVVTPKKTACVLIGTNGDLIPVTDDGALLRPLAADAVPDVPLLRGETFNKDTKLRARAVAFVMSLGDDGPVGRSGISEITWNAEDGFRVALIQPRVEVKFGQEKLSMKVLRVNQVLNYLSANQLKGRVIDASFSKKVLVRLRKDP